MKYTTRGRRGVQCWNNIKFSPLSLAQYACVLCESHSTRLDRWINTTAAIHPTNKKFFFFFFLLPSTRPPLFWSVTRPDVDVINFSFGYDILLEDDSLSSLSIWSCVVKQKPFLWQEGQVNELFFLMKNVGVRLLLWRAPRVILMISSFHV